MLARRTPPGHQLRLQRRHGRGHVVRMRDHVEQLVRHRMSSASEMSGSVAPAVPAAIASPTPGGKRVVRLVAMPHVDVAGGTAVARRERDDRSRDSGCDRQDASGPAARVQDGRVDRGRNGVDRQRARDRDRDAAPRDVERDRARACRSRAYRDRVGLVGGARRVVKRNAPKLPGRVLPPERRNHDCQHGPGAELGPRINGAAHRRRHPGRNGAGCEALPDHQGSERRPGGARARLGSIST